MIQAACGARAFRQRVLGTLRAIGLCFTVFFLLGFFTYQKAQAQAGELLLSYGDQIARWDGARAHSGVRVLRVNGSDLRVMSLSFQEDLSVVLSRLESECKMVSGLQLGGSEHATFAPTLRHESGDQGVVSCLDTGGPQTLSEVGARLERFSESTDLRDVGYVRYAFARQAAETTTVLLIWTEGSLTLREMFPTGTDAPGVDPEGVPRPSGSRRILSAAEVKQPYSANVYRIDAARRESLSDFHRRAEAAGWVVTETRPQTLTLERDGRFVLVHSSEKEGVFSIFELR